MCGTEVRWWIGVKARQSYDGPPDGWNLLYRFLIEFITITETPDIFIFFGEGDVGEEESWSIQSNTVRDACQVHYTKKKIYIYFNGIDVDNGDWAILKEQSFLNLEACIPLNNITI